MKTLRIALVGCWALLLTMTLHCAPAHAAGLRVVPSTSSITAGSDFYFDIVADNIPSDGLGGVQFRLNVSIPGTPAGTVIGTTDLSQAGAGNVAVASPLLMSPATATRSGIGDFFLGGQGSNGILAIDNETLTNGSSLYTFSHTSGSTPPSGSGSVARFMVRVGTGVNGSQINIGLSDVMLMDGGPATTRRP